MRRRLGQHRVGLWARACWVLLAAGVLAPGQAWAGCSHYAIARGADRALEANGLDARELFATRKAPAVPPPHRAPCAGPSCGRKAIPPAAPAAVVPFNADGWAWLPQLQHARPAFSTVIADQPRAGRPRRGGYALERPPR